MSNNFLILGIGNTIRGDDGIGIAIARALKEKLKTESVAIKETSEVGLNLLDLMNGFQRVIIIDSIHLGRDKPGTIYDFDSTGFVAQSSHHSTHKLGLPTVLQMAIDLELEMPDDINIIAVEVGEIDNFSEEISPDIQKTIPLVLNMIETKLNKGV